MQHTEASEPFVTFFTDVFLRFIDIDRIADKVLRIVAQNHNVRRNFIVWGEAFELAPLLDFFCHNNTSSFCTLF